MVKTLIITSSFAPVTGGAQQYMLEICKRVPADALIVLTHGTGSEAERTFDAAQPYKIIRENFFHARKPKWWGAYQKAKEIVTNEQNEQIEEIWAGDILPSGTIARLLNKPYIIFAHGRDLLEPLSHPLKKLLVTQILKKAATLIASSTYPASIYKKYSKSVHQKIELIHPCVDTEFFKPVPKTTNHPPTIISIGRIDRRKGYDNMIKAFPRVTSQIPEAQYHIYGSGDEAEISYIKNLIHQTQQEKSITFHDQKVPAEQLVKTYQSGDVFVMLPRQIGPNVEGFGMVFLEASACGIPVVAGRSGGVEDAVKNEVSGLLVNPTDTEEISQAVIKLLKDDQLRNKLGMQGRAWVEANFQWDDRVKKLLKQREQQRKMS